MFRVGIVGLGEVADWHERGVGNTPRAAVTAVADLDADRRERRARAWGATPYPDAESMLADAALDWVHVCTPAQTHREVALACIDAGVHVLVEKPFVLDREAFEAVTAAADEAGVRVTVVHNQVYYDPIQRALARVRGGEFGRVHGVSVLWGENNSPGDPDRGEWVLDLPGGEFGEGVVHPIYVGLRAAGYPADESAIGVHTVGDSDLGFDGIAVSFTTADGTACTVQHHSGVPDRRQVVFATDDGHVTADVATQSVTVQRESFGPNATADRPGLAAGRDALTRGLSAATSALRSAVRSAVTGTSPHDTHTPVIRREARAIRGSGPGPTPRAEADWTNRIYTRLVD